MKKFREELMGLKENAKNIKKKEDKNLAAKEFRNIIAEIPRELKKTANMGEDFLTIHIPYGKVEELIEPLLKNWSTENEFLYSVDYIGCPVKSIISTCGRCKEEKLRVTKWHFEEGCKKDEHFYYLCCISF